MGPAMPFPVPIPFVDHLGFVLQAMADGQARIAFEPRPEHLNSFSVVHGGALMTLLDVTMAHAARSTQPELGAVTVEMKTSFMRAAQGPLLASGQLLHRSATLAFVEAGVRDAQGRLCAQASGTFKMVPRLPVAGREVRGLNARPATP